MSATKRSPFYSQVEDGILEKINSGDFAPASRIPSIRELAQQFEVAKSTVERAVYRLVDRGILRAQQGKGVFVSETLPRRDQGKTRVIGLLPTMHISVYTSRGFYSEVLAGVQSALMDRNWSMLVINEEGAARAAGAVNLHAELVDGYIVIGPVSNRFVSLVRKAGKPIVFVDHDGSTLGYDSVVADNVKGGLLLTKYLIDQGHRDLAFIGGVLKQEPDPQDSHLIDTSARERFQGFTLGLEVEGIEPKNERLIKVAERTSDDAFDAFKETWDGGQRPSGVVCFDSSSARGVTQFLQKKGLEVPRDVSVVGFAAGAEIDGMHLTGVDFDYRLMGQIGGKLAVERVERGYDAFRKEVVPVFFVEGDSTAPPREK